MSKLKNLAYGIAATAMSVLPSKADAGTLYGRVTEMFSGNPVRNAPITLVNDSGDVYKTQTRSDATAVAPSSWGIVKTLISPNNRLPKLNTTGAGHYTLELPDGVYTMAISDGLDNSAKFAKNDLYNIGFDPSRNEFVPRVFGIRVNGDTRYDEQVLPKDFDLEFAWTVIGDKVAKYDYDNTIFYIDANPARDNFLPNPDGKRPSTDEIEKVEMAIRDFVSLDTNGRKNPNIQIGTNPPDFVPNPNNEYGGMMVQPGYALFFWDEGLGRGIAGTGLPWVDEDGKIIASFASVLPHVGLHTIRNEVLGAAGLHGEPGTRRELDRRIRDTGSSVFLDGGTDDPTERDKQIIMYSGLRPAGTRSPDITDRIVNE